MFDSLEQFLSTKKVFLYFLAYSSIRFTIYFKRLGVKGPTPFVPLFSIFIIGSVLISFTRSSYEVYSIIYYFILLFVMGIFISFFVCMRIVKKDRNREEMKKVFKKLFFVVMEMAGIFILMYWIAMKLNAEFF